MKLTQYTNLHVKQCLKCPKNINHSFLFLKNKVQGRIDIIMYILWRGIIIFFSWPVVLTASMHYILCK